MTSCSSARHWCYLALFVCLIGCGSGAPFTLSGVRVASHLRGAVHGGQQPVIGAHVYLFAAGTGGRQTASNPVLNAAATGLSDAEGAYVTTDAQGGFSITGDYTCPLGGAMVYALATGGDPGLGNGQINPDIALMSALGSCDDLLANASSRFIVINEVTTVVAAKNLSSFVLDAFHVATDGGAVQTRELRDAFDAVPRFLDPNTGALLQTTPAGDATIPVATINTLANILAGCVNSAGSTAESSGVCAVSEFVASAATGTNAANTTDVILGILAAPTEHVALLFGLSPPFPSFQPTLPSAPASLAPELELLGGMPACAPICQTLAVAAGSQGEAAFLPDEYSSGGNTVTVGIIIDVSHVIDPAPLSVYQSDRYGFFTYVPGYVPGSAHRLRLHFAETFWPQVNQRVFDVSVNGVPVLRNFDIVRAAGAKFVANVQEAVVVADRDGFLHLELEHASVDNPELSGFEIY